MNWNVIVVRTSGGANVQHDPTGTVERAHCQIKERSVAYGMIRMMRSDDIRIMMNIDFLGAIVEI